MKVLNIFPLLLFASIILSACQKNDPEIGKPILAVSTDIDMPDKAPGVFIQLSDLKKVSFIFSEPVNEQALKDNIVLEKLEGRDAQSIVPVNIIMGNKTTEIKVEPTNPQQFSSEGIYSLTFKSQLKSEQGNYLEEPYKCYFIIVPEGNDLSAGTKRYTAVISDIHMGDARSAKGGYGWFIKNKQKLVDFLDYIIKNKNDYKELVIAGDLFDEWVAPMDAETFADEAGNHLTQSQFALKIAEYNKEVIDKFKLVHANGVKLTYVPGNHDMLLEATDIDAIFGSGVVNQARDAKGLGAYSPSHDMVIEHGHRYDFYNAPDQMSNINIEGVTAENAILPAGFFVTKYATTSALEQKIPGQRVQLTLSELEINGELEVKIKEDNDLVNNLIYDVSWLAILAKERVENAMDRDVKTGIAGYVRDYKVEEITPTQKQVLYTTAYKSAEWSDRLAKNKSVYIPFVAGVVAGAYNPVYPYIATWVHTLNDKRIVVFGHTHEAYLGYTLTSTPLLFGIYANAGTWVDNNGDNPTCTFVEIYEGEGRFLDYKQVAICKFENKETKPIYLKDPLWIYTKNE